RLVVLFVIADEVVQREAVMRGDEVDARPRASAAVTEDVGRADDAGSDLRYQPFVALPEAPNRVAVLRVPLGPARRHFAELIAVGAEIPRLGNQLDPRHRGVLADRVEKRRALAVFAVLARQCGREIEPEAVDMHFERPIAQ